MPTSAPGPPPAPQAVVARGLGLVVDGARILDDISLVLRRGERWAVLGPNGSGKTSLVRLFAAYAYPSEGTLQVLGERFGRTDLRRLRARIGWVHSDVRYQIPPFMSAAEVVMSRARGGLVLYGEVPAAALVCNFFTSFLELVLPSWSQTLPFHSQATPTSPPPHPFC